MYQLIYELLLEGAREKQKHEITRALQLRKNARAKRSQHNVPIKAAIKDREEMGLPPSRNPNIPPEWEKAYKDIRRSEGKAERAAEKVVRGAVQKVSGHEAKLEGEEGRRRSAEAKAKAAEAKLSSDPKTKKKSLRLKRREAVAKGRLAKLKTAETRVKRRKAAMSEREKLSAEAQKQLGLKYKASTGDISDPEHTVTVSRTRKQQRKTSKYGEYLKKQLEDARARQNAGMPHKKGMSPEEIQDKINLHKKEEAIKKKETPEAGYGD